MVVRNIISPVVRDVLTTRYSPPTAAVKAVFASGEQGVWYEVNDPNLGWRRNKLTWTEQFDNAAWTKTGATVTANSATAPDGTLTADTITNSGGTGNCNQVVVVPAGVTYTFSVWVKRRTGTGAVYLVDVNGTNLDIASSLTSTFQRFSVTAVASTTTGRAYIRVVDSGDEVDVWGAQLEQASTTSTYQRITDGNTEDFTALTGTIPTLYQNSAGVTPCSTPGQGVAMPVGLMLDKHKGLVLGDELVTNGSFDAWADSTVPDGWSKTGTHNGSNYVEQSPSGSLRLVSDGTYVAIVTSPTGLSIGKTYLVTGYASSVADSGIGILLGVGTDVLVGSAGAFSFVMTATGTNLEIKRYAALGTVDVTLDNISVREVPGNHAFQSTSASRPALSGRYNLLTYTEQFDNAAWTKNNATVTANATTAPDGTLTADKVVEDTANAQHRVLKSLTFGSRPVTASCYFKAAERSFAFIRIDDSVSTEYAYFNLATGATAAKTSGLTTFIDDVGDGWYRCTARFDTVTSGAGSIIFASAPADNTSTYTGDGTSGIYIWGADLRVSNDSLNIPSYQRVVDALTYDTTGFPLYLECDGVDDGMVTNSIDFSASDKMFVAAGVRKLGTASSALVENYTTTTAHDTFSLQPKATDYLLVTTGSSAFSAVTTPANYSSPITNVVSAFYDKAGASATLQNVCRVNGVLITLDVITAGPAGSGTFGNYPLYLFRRGGTTLPYNGRFYNLVVRGGALPSEAQVAQVETYLNLTTRVNVEPQDILLESGDTLALENNDQLSVDQPFAR